MEYPCNEADDQAWSRIVLRSAIMNCLSQAQQDDGAMEPTYAHADDGHHRLTTGPAGTYFYNGAHLDAVTGTSGGYTGSYDDAGDLQCRAPNSSQTCQGTQTGQQLSYDQLRRLLNWQNATSNPTVRAHYAYDGENERVIQNTGPVTYYLGGYTEVTVNGSSTTTTNYYGAGVSTAVSVNGTITYLVADGLGSASESLSSSGSVQGAQLFAPYGSVRYSTGSMSTTKGFTGQLSDPSGLSYFHARYYDPVVGQFTSADTVQGPNRYAYVGGNPESRTDPTGRTVSCGPIPMVAGGMMPLCGGSGNGNGVTTGSGSGSGTNGGKHGGCPQCTGAAITLDNAPCVQNTNLLDLCMFTNGEQGVLSRFNDQNVNGVCSFVGYTLGGLQSLQMEWNTIKGNTDNYFANLEAQIGAGATVGCGLAALLGGAPGAACAYVGGAEILDLEAQHNGLDTELFGPLGSKLQSFVTDIQQNPSVYSDVSATILEFDVQPPGDNGWGIIGGPQFGELYAGDFELELCSNEACNSTIYHTDGTVTSI